MEQLYNYLPRELVTFVLVTLFSLLIGLSQRRISLKREGETTLFGTDRTFTFIGILGYLLYILDPMDMRLFMGGGAILGLLLGLNYYVKQSQFHVFGVTTIIIALITYCIAPIVATQPSWFYVMVIVTVLLLTELKHTFTEFAQRMKNDEMITLAKFLAISGIILPMLPNKNLIPDINLTPYSIWLATVVVSGISYLSYLLKRYVFHESGILVSGIVGGLYSSTATISVLARKSRKASEQENDKTRENVSIIMEKVGSLETVVNYLQKALQALLRDRIIQMYNYYYKDAGYIPMYARESLDHMYEEYKNLGGNGVIDSLVAKLKTLDIEPVDDSSDN